MAFASPTTLATALRIRDQAPDTVEPARTARDLLTLAMHRPERFTTAARRQARFLWFFDKSRTVTEAAVLAGIDRRTVSRWRLASQAFDARCVRMVGDSQRDAYENAVLRLPDPIVVPVYYRGQKVGEYTKRNFAMDLYLLKRADAQSLREELRRDGRSVARMAAKLDDRVKAEAEARVAAKVEARLEAEFQARVAKEVERQLAAQLDRVARMNSDTVTPQGAPPAERPAPPARPSRPAAAAMSRSAEMSRFPGHRDMSRSPVTSPMSQLAGHRSPSMSALLASAAVPMGISLAVTGSLAARSIAGKSLLQRAAAGA